MDTSVLGVDASLAGTGLCVLNPYERFVVFDRILFKEAFDKSFKGLFQRVLEVSDNYSKFLEYWKPDEVVMESPLPVGQMSAGGSSLCTALSFRTLVSYHFFYTLHPSFLRHVLGKKDYKHSEIVDLARRIMEQEQFKSSLRLFSADEAVAFLLAYRISIRGGYTPRVVETRFNVQKEIEIRGVEEWQSLRLQRETVKG